MKLRTWCIRIGHILTKTGSALKMALLLMLVCLAGLAHAEIDTQGITIRQQNAPLEKVFQSIEKQTGYRFFYNESLLQGAGKVSLNLQNVSLQEALDACFQHQPFTYSIVDRTIIVKRKVAVASHAATAPLNKIIAVRGKVMSNNVPVAGATVTVKGTENATSTDHEGVFTLGDVDDQSTLVVTHVNHKVREVRLKGEGFITIDLDTKVSDLDEAVVVAYSTTTQKRNTGSVTVVKGGQIATLPNRSVDKSLQGLVPGLLVTSGTGQPGGGISNFVLRGIATGDNGLNGSTARNPLIIIDGMPITQDHTQWATSLSEAPVINPMAQLNPSDIESITVLKDAAAIALYGSKAGNGVILITTKKGKIGKTTFNFRHQTDISRKLKGNVELLNQDEYIELLYETYKNTPRNPTPWTDDLILADLKSKFLVRADGSFYPETKWADEVYSNHATTVSNELSVSGGNEKSSYYLNFEYTKQNGIVKKTGYDRKSLRFNFDNRLTNWFKIGINTGLSYNTQNYSTLTGGTYPIGIATFFPPLVPARTENGNLILSYTFPFQVANPLAATKYNTNRNIAYRALSKLYAELSFLKDFKFSSNVGLDFMLTEAKEKADPRLYDSYTQTIGSGRVQERDTRNANFIATNILQFDRTVGRDHSINVLLGQEAQILQQKYMMATAKNLSFPEYDQISNGGSRSADGVATKQTLLSYFGQANYGYNKKYYASASIRRDGSSKFGERQRFGTYWSTGLGWVITEENFMKKPALSWINFFKIRGSIGAAGNSGAIDRFTRYDLLQMGIYSNGLAVYPGANPGNPEIQWEETKTWDAGVEARFLNERIGITADIYERKTSDLIYTSNLPLVSGYVTVLNNIGNMKNNGIELSLSADVIKSRSVLWRFNANWSTNRNILVKANVPLAAVSGNIIGNEEGRNFNSFYMVRWAGVDPADGSPQYLDKDDNITKTFSTNDRVFVGKPQPDGFGAVTNTISYKNIEVSAQLYYQYGFQIFNNNALTNDGSSPFMNQDKRALDYWKKPGDVTSNPKRTLNNSTTAANTTRFLFDGDFIRLQNVSMAYNVSKRIADKLHASMIKVFVQGYNLAIWNKFPGEDPANANVQGGVSLTYPNQQSVSMGLNVIF